MTAKYITLLALLSAGPAVAQPTDQQIIVSIKEYAGSVPVSEMQKRVATIAECLGTRLHTSGYPADTTLLLSCVDSKNAKATVTSCTWSQDVGRFLCMKPAIYSLPAFKS